MIGFLNKLFPKFFALCELTRRAEKLAGYAEALFVGTALYDAFGEDMSGALKIAEDPDRLSDLGLDLTDERLLFVATVMAVCRRELDIVEEEKTFGLIFYVFQ